MIKLDDNLLAELGLRDLPAKRRDLVKRAIYSELEARVGAVLAGRMSNEQLNEFEAFIKVNNNKGAFGWLESNFPDYKTVVNDEFAKLRSEIMDTRDSITAVSACYQDG